MIKASLFDLDHTLLSVNSSFSFGVYLYRQKVFSTAIMLNLARVYFLHKAGFFSLNKLHQKTFEILFLNQDADRITQHIQPFINNVLSAKFYQPTLKRLEEAKKKGHFISILSNSPDFLVGPIADYLNVSHWKATIYKIDTFKKFRCITSFFEGEEKLKYLNECILKYGIVKENMIAYSDSILDLPFLKGAGIAVAVNPDRELKHFAAKNYWEII